MHRIWLAAALVGCGDGSDHSPRTGVLATPGVPEAAIQVEVASASPLPASARFDVWATQDGGEPQITARLAADDAVLLRVQPGSWDVWATASVTVDEDSGVVTQTLQCSGRAADVVVSGQGTTVLRLDTVCQRLGPPKPVR
jgi:hypothetical protein